MQQFRRSTRVASLVVAVLACVPLLVLPSCGPDSYGYGLAALTSDFSTIKIRYQQSGVWTDAASVQPVASRDFIGVAMAQSTEGIESVLAYTVGSTLHVHVGLGPNYFDAHPAYDLAGVASGPSITHISGDEWLFAYSDANGRLQLRRYLSSTSGGFRNVLDLSSVAGSDSLATGPAIAYFKGKLAVVWQRINPREFRFAALNYTAGGSVSVAGSGVIPDAGGTFVPEFQSAPALAHDGQGTYYLAAVHRSGLSGLTFDAVHVYSSTSGTDWMAVSSQGLSGATGQTRVAVAAKPDGELLLALVDGERAATLNQLKNGTWTNVGTMPWHPDFSSELALMRFHYVAGQSPSPATH